MTGFDETKVRELAMAAERLYRQAALQHLAGDARATETRQRAKEALVVAGVARARAAASRPVSALQEAAGEAAARERADAQDAVVWDAVLRAERAGGQPR